MPVKVFTLDEANRLLPKIEEELLWLQQAVKAIAAAQDSLAVLQVIGGSEEKSPEHRGMLSTRVTLENMVEEYNGRLEALQNLGVVIKDVNTGLVDFYGQKDGRLIFLCWRLGEKKVAFWHEINNGMVNRRPASEL